MHTNISYYIMDRITQRKFSRPALSLSVYISHRRAHSGLFTAIVLNGKLPNDSLRVHRSAPFFSIQKFGECVYYSIQCHHKFSIRVSSKTKDFRARLIYLLRHHKTKIRNCHCSMINKVFSVDLNCSIILILKPIREISYNRTSR